MSRIDSSGGGIGSAGPSPAGAGAHSSGPRVPSGAELVDRHTRGLETDVKAIASDLKQATAARPQDATVLMKSALERLPVDQRDELAQEFVEQHSDAELKALGAGAAGKGALALAVNELGQGKVHRDEAATAARVGDALGQKIELDVNTGWGAVSKWVHGALDVAGFIPGLGAVPDLINAGIYAAEGDLANASLSALAAVPAVGDAAKGATMAAKAGREVAEAGARRVVREGAEQLGEKAVKEGVEAGAESAAKKTAGEVATHSGDDAAAAAGRGGKAARATELSALPKHLDAARLTRGADGLITHVDGKKLETFVNDMVTRRADEYRGLRQSGVEGFSNRDTGPVVSIVVDRRTGRVFEGTNTQIKSTDQLDPLLRQRVADLDAAAAKHGPFEYGGKGTGAHPHPSTPGTHAEVSAVDQALKARRAAGETVTWETARRDLFYDNAFLDKNATRTAPTCANCTPILDGIPSNVGHFTSFPPKP